MKIYIKEVELDYEGEENSCELCFFNNPMNSNPKRKYHCFAMPCAREAKSYYYIEVKREK